MVRAPKQQMEIAQNMRQQAQQDPTRAVELTTKRKKIEKHWRSEPVRRVAAHGVVDGLTGGNPRIVGAVSENLGAPSVADALKENDIPEPLVDTNDCIGEHRSGRPNGNTISAASAVNEIFGNYLADNFENRTENALKSASQQASYPKKNWYIRSG